MHRFPAGRIVRLTEERAAVKTCRPRGVELDPRKHRNGAWLAWVPPPSTASLPRSMVGTEPIPASSNNSSKNTPMRCRASSICL